MVHQAFIALGSNLGDRQHNLQQALSLLTQELEIKLVQVSSFYETDPVGMKETEPAEPFVNAVAAIETSLSPGKLLSLCLQIEQILGRKRSLETDCGLGYSSRTLDLDILFYDQAIIHDESLDIPHPRLNERAFVLTPLLEIAPDWVHPVLGQTIKQLASLHQAQHALAQ